MMTKAYTSPYLVLAIQNYVVKAIEGVFRLVDYFFGSYPSGMETKHSPEFPVRSE